MGIQILGSSASVAASQNSISEATALSSDTQALKGLRGTAARDPKAAIKEAAKQFESLFMNELMKRSAKPRKARACWTTPAPKWAPTCWTTNSR
jgi:Rod binding domain-containing protein